MQRRGAEFEHKMAVRAESETKWVEKAPKMIPNRKFGEGNTRV